MNETVKNTNELLDHLIKIVEENSERFSFEWATVVKLVKWKSLIRKRELGM